MSGNLRGVVDREKVQIGVLITMQAPTQQICGKKPPQRASIDSLWWTKHPRLQLLTISDLLAGKQVDYPQTRGNVTLKQVSKAKDETAE